MGIPGLWDVLEPSRKRIAFTKLAEDYREQYGRPLRLAVDASIWSFQIKAGKGGLNPDLRTLYYRLSKLMLLGIHPLFVFDGPFRPECKRNHKMSHIMPFQITQMKRLVKLFGFPLWDAPGEAEAECAVLQSRGLVDIVMTEDVDCIMFGGTRVIRNWSPESNTKSPTHVDLYENMNDIDRMGMVLIALMHGGDYLPEGIPNCGIRVAVEAARAGLGDHLKDPDFRDVLIESLQTNKNKHFLTKHPAIKVPDTFPDLQVLDYYLKPVLTSPTEYKDIDWSAKPDLEGLVCYCQDVLGWVGTGKLIKSLSPSYLVWKLATPKNYKHKVHGGKLSDIYPSSKPHVQLLIESVSSSRRHFSADYIQEFRISFIPSKVLPIKLVDFEDSESAQSEESEPYAQQFTIKKKFDPSMPMRVWLPETIVRSGAREAVRKYEYAQFVKKTILCKKTTKLGSDQRGAIDTFLVKIGASDIPLPPKRSSLKTKPLQKVTVAMERNSDIDVVSLPKRSSFVEKVTKDGNSSSICPQQASVFRCKPKSKSTLSVQSKLVKYPQVSPSNRAYKPWNLSWGKKNANVSLPTLKHAHKLNSSAECLHSPDAICTIKEETTNNNPCIKYSPRETFWVKSPRNKMVKDDDTLLDMFELQRACAPSDSATIPNEIHLSQKTFYKEADTLPCQDLITPHVRTPVNKKPEIVNLCTPDSSD